MRERIQISLIYKIFRMQVNIDRVCYEIMHTKDHEKLNILSDAVCTMVSNVMRYNKWIEENTTNQ